MSGDAIEDGRLTALVDLLGRSGATTYSIEHAGADELDALEGTEVIWLALARYQVNGRPTQHLEAAAGPGPYEATMRLAEQLIDGGTCTHCGRMTSIDDDPFGAGVLDAIACVYRYDPELKRYRRQCEGEAT